MSDFAELLAAHPKWQQHAIHGKQTGWWTRSGWVRTEQSGVFVSPVSGRLVTIENPAPWLDHPATKGVMRSVLHNELGDWFDCSRMPHGQWQVVDCETNTVYCAVSGSDGDAFAAGLLKAWGS